MSEEKISREMAEKLIKSVKGLTVPVMAIWEEAGLIKSELKETREKYEISLDSIKALEKEIERLPIYHVPRII